ncbi:MAG: hypothetical protein QXW70_04325 [Candidatus Anstonellales archaeon]
MKKIIFAFVFLFFIGGCISTSSKPYKEIGFLCSNCKNATDPLIYCAEMCETVAYVCNLDLLYAMLLNDTVSDVGTPTCKCEFQYYDINQLKCTTKASEVVGS